MEKYFLNVKMRIINEYIKKYIRHILLFQAISSSPPPPPPSNPLEILYDGEIFGLL